jgi:hypothetical protein
MADTLFEYVHALLPEEREVLVLAYNHHHSDGRIHEGKLPFTNRRMMIDYLKGLQERLDDDIEDDLEEVYIGNEKVTANKLETYFEVTDFLLYLLKRPRLTSLTKAQVNASRERFLEKLRGV